MLANSVAILSDGGFVATKFFDPTVPNAFNDIFQGKITGNVYEWHPGGRVSAIPGTDLSGANGIAVSLDDKWVYVATTGTLEIIRFDRTEVPVKLKKVKIEGIVKSRIRYSVHASTSSARTEYQKVKPFTLSMSKGECNFLRSRQDWHHA
jgi:sugar lactone lactonase YvrE